MRIYNLLILLAVLSLSPYAYSQIPFCPCDNEELQNGNSGDEIVDILCPDGNLAADAQSVLTQTEVAVLRPGAGGTGLGYFVIDGGVDGKVCILSQDLAGVLFVDLSDEEFGNCKQRLIRGCNLTLATNIPTLSEWGMIGMAGALGMIGLYVAARRRKAAA